MQEITYNSGKQFLEGMLENAPAEIFTNTEHYNPIVDYGIDDAVSASLVSIAYVTNDTVHRFMLVSARDSSNIPIAQHLNADNQNQQIDIAGVLEDYVPENSEIALYLREGTISSAEGFTCEEGNNLDTFYNALDDVLEKTDSKERDGVIYNEGNKLIFQYRPDTEGAMNKTVDTWIEAVKTHYDGEKIPLDFSAIAGGFTNDVYVDALFGDYALQLYIPNGSTKQHYGTNIKTIAQKMRTELREIVDIVDRNQQVVRSPDKFRLLGIVAGEDDNSNGIVLC